MMMLEHDGRDWDNDAEVVQMRLGCKWELCVQIQAELVGWVGGLVSALIVERDAPLVG